MKVFQAIGPNAVILLLVCGPTIGIMGLATLPDNHPKIAVTMICTCAFCSVLMGILVYLSIA